MAEMNGAVMCEIVGLYALNKLRTRFGNNNIGLYRDDGLALIEGNSPRLADRARKDLCSAFKELALKITAEVNYKTAKFLEFTLKLILPMSLISLTENQITNHFISTKNPTTLHQ